MFKFLVISVLLWQKILCQCSDQQPECPLFGRNKLGVQPSETKNYIFHGTNIQVYLNSAFGIPAVASIQDFNSVLAITKPPIRADYNVTDGIGAHKLYTNRLTWNQARRACLSDGGHLAIIRSDVEHSIIVRMMTENSAVDAWLGLHDLFEEGDWVTVLGENLTQVGWSKWSALIIPNPDNFHGKQHCARIMRDGNGIDDLQCESTLPFVCKISIQ